MKPRRIGSFTSENNFCISKSFGPALIGTPQNGLLVNCWSRSFCSRLIIGDPNVFTKSGLGLLGDTVWSFKDRITSTLTRRKFFHNQISFT